MSWSLSIPWPLERIIRQYVGFNGLVIREYGDLVGCHETDNRFCYLDEKRSGSHSIIAQWRSEHNSFKKNIYHFRFVFDKNWNGILLHSNEYIVRAGNINCKYL